MSVIFEQSLYVIDDFLVSFINQFFNNLLQFDEVEYLQFYQILNIIYSIQSIFLLRLLSFYCEIS
jgi:hypothetical protein